MPYSFPIQRNDCGVTSVAQEKETTRQAEIPKRASDYPAWRTGKRTPEN